jgi:hypothetical protein
MKSVKDFDYPWACRCASQPQMDATTTGNTKWDFTQLSSVHCQGSESAFCDISLEAVI